MVGEETMTTWARNISNSAIDVVTSDPALLYHSSIAKTFIVVPDVVQNHWGFNPSTATWSAPTPSTAPVTGANQPMTAMQFYLAFTPSERIAIKRSTDPMIAEFWATFQLAAQQNHMIDPTLNSVIDGVNYLAIPATATPPGPGIVVAARIPQILAGVPQ
jgi:hypothetical protein